MKHFHMPKSLFEAAAHINPASESRRGGKKRGGKKRPAKAKTKKSSRRRRR